MVERRCLYRFGLYEAENYRRTRLRGSRGDQGRQAVREWNEKHWWSWCLQKFLEHLQGEMFWEQFGDSTFGLLNPALRRASRRARSTAA